MVLLLVQTTGYPGMLGHEAGAFHPRQAAQSIHSGRIKLLMLINRTIIEVDLDERSSAQYFHVPVEVFLEVPAHGDNSDEAGGTQGDG